MDRALRHYCAVWGRRPPSFISTVVKDGITIRENREGDFVMVFGPKGPCFILEIDPITKHCTMRDIESGRWGDTYFFSDSDGLVKCALEAAKNNGASQIELIDNSVLLCPNLQERIYLPELSFITTGFTWYELQIPGLMPLDAVFADRLAVWRANVKTRRWAEVAPFILEVADQGSPEELAADVLMRLRLQMQLHKSGTFFANNMDNLRKAFGIERKIHGSSWTTPA